MGTHRAFSLVRIPLQTGYVGVPVPDRTKSPLNEAITASPRVRATRPTSRFFRMAIG